MAISINLIFGLLFLYLFIKREAFERYVLGRSINKCMRIFELEQPKSAEQFKLDQLKAVNKRASLAVKNEREKQKLQHANKALQQLHKPKAATVVPKKTIKPIKPIQPIKPSKLP